MSLTDKPDDPRRTDSPAYGAVRKPWTAIGCTRYCDGGRKGMDNCNACGRTGSMLMFRADRKTYSNTRDGWLKMLEDHPGEIADSEGDQS